MSQTATSGLTVHQPGGPEGNPSTIDIAGELPEVPQIADLIWQIGFRVAGQLLVDTGKVTITATTEGTPFNQLWIIRMETVSDRPVLLEVHRVGIGKSTGEEEQRAIAEAIGTPKESAFIEAGHRALASMAEIPIPLVLPTNIVLCRNGDGQGWRITSQRQIGDEGITPFMNQALLSLTQGQKNGVAQIVAPSPSPANPAQ